VSGSRWSAQLSGLVRGANTLTVTATNQAGDVASVKGTITLLSTPGLTLDAPPAVSARAQLVIGGSVDAGLTPVVALNTAATAGPVTTSAGGTRWSSTLSNLVPGSNIVTVVVVDQAGNLAVQSAQVKYAPSDGDLNLDGGVDLADALGALRVAVGIDQPGAEAKAHADVAPLVNGAPSPDGAVDLLDALVILKKVVGSLSF